MYQPLLFHSFGKINITMLTKQQKVPEEVRDLISQILLQFTLRLPVRPPAPRGFDKSLSHLANLFLQLEHEPRIITGKTIACSVSLGDGFAAGLKR